MRTKTLLLTAALSAAGIATSMAQVYSVNAVGYVNTTLLPGFNLISNPLDNKTGNSVANLFNTGMTTVPGGLVVYVYNAVNDTFIVSVNDDLGGGFQPPANAATEVRPGDGMFVNLPGTANATVTFVGEVPQSTGGTPLSNPLPTGFSIKSSQVPQAGTVTALGYTGAPGDVIYKWDAVADRYVSYVFDDLGGGWQPSEPTLAVGEAFFLFKSTAGTWNRTFSVN
jgi:hypothetical protein